MASLKSKRECSVCTTVIFDWDPKTDKLRTNEEYNEVEVELNDRSRMRTGVCSKHTALSKKDLPTITEKTHKGWLEEVAYGIGNAEWVKHKGLSLEVVGIVK